MTDQSLRVVREHDGLAVGEVANVCVTIWRSPVTRSRFVVQQDGLAEVVRRHPGGIGFLCVIEATATPPNEELRRASARMILQHQSALRGIACIVEGRGFVNATARSALSAMALIAGASRRVPLAVFGSVPAGTTWMAPRTEMRDSGALTRAVESMRSKMAARSAGAA